MLSEAGVDWIFEGALRRKQRPLLLHCRLDIQGHIETQAETSPDALQDPEDSSDLEPDGSNGSGSDEDTQEALPINGIGSTPALPSNGNVRAPARNNWKIPAFKPPYDSFQPHWTHR